MLDVAPHGIWQRSSRLRSASVGDGGVVLSRAGKSLRSEPTLEETSSGALKSGGFMVHCLV
ncbi:hypothetical protein KCP69_25700 [Salmonella enterica subsp. enterica]|nr:hypothetical protein KCP69_25700 [Salmonella enterica subsp. enterica]